MSSVQEKVKNILMRLSGQPLPVYASIFILALALRIVFAFQWHDTPYGAAPLLDAKAYDDWAQSIASGQWLRTTAFYQSPLFPYVLAVLYKVFGHSYLMISLFNAFLDSCIAVILSMISRCCFGIAAAAITGVLAALYGPFIFYSAPVMKEPLGQFLLSLFLLYALRALRENRLRDFMLCGAGLGLGALVRGNVLLLAPALAALAVFSLRRAALRNITAFFLMVFICVSPATLHNFIAARDFVPINYNAGFNLYIGHYPAANGTNAYPPEVSTDPEQEEAAVVAGARLESGRALKPSEVSGFWRDKAVNFIFHNPGREAALLVNKLRAFWNGGEQFDNYDVPFIRNNFHTLLSWPLPGFLLVSCLAAFAAIARKERPETAALIVLAGAYMASVILFYVTDRYRLPVVIFMMPLAGAAIPAAAGLMQAKNRAVLAASTALSCIFLLLGLMPEPDPQDLTAFDWGTLSMMVADQGHAEESLEMLGKGISLSPQTVGANALARGADTEQALGNDGESQRLLDMALTYYSSDPITLYTVGRLKTVKGEFPEALSALQKAEAAAPGFILNYYVQAMIYEKLGDRDNALRVVSRGLFVAPDDPMLLKELADIKNH